LFQEEDQRLQILGNLEAVHEELKGEHSQDVETGENLKVRRETVTTEIQEKKETIEEEKQRLWNLIKEIEGLHEVVKGDIAREEKETH